MSKHRRNGRNKEAAAPIQAVDARETLMDVVIQAGVEALHVALENAVSEVCGERNSRRSGALPRRWGRQQGWVVLAGRRVHVGRPRVRQRGKEVALPAYAEFQREDALDARALEQMLVGVSTRAYRRSLPDFGALEESGTSKSAVSRRLVAATAKRLEALLSRPLQGIAWAAVMLDGLRFGRHVILVALGVDAEGKKHLLGLWAGATENAAVCRELIADLVARGLPGDRHLLFVMDGAKALRKAVQDAFGERGLVQRCTVHKKRNVLDHLPDALRPRIASALDQAWRADSFEVARRQLHNLAKLLAKEHPGAAASLREGLEETLTVKQLGVTGTLERTLRSTNPIENLNGSVRRITGRVRRCRGGQMALRWVAAAVLEAERGFRRLSGYRDLPKLTLALRELDRQNQLAKERNAG